MEDLIKALQIFLKYSNTKYPTHCEHDILFVGISPSIVSKEDTEELNRLGFFVEDGWFASHRFGSM